MKKTRLSKNCVCGAQASLYYDQEKSQLVIKCRGITKDKPSGLRHTLRLPVDPNLIKDEKYRNNATMHIIKQWEQTENGKTNDSKAQES